jgi:long-chain acyl-CoA synthetase
MTVEGTTTLSLAAVLAESAIRRPEHAAVVQGDRRLTYAQLWHLAARYAQALIDRGVGPGDRVALMAPNTIEFVAGYFGIVAAGGTIVPVPAMLQPKEAAYLLQHSGARSVVADPSLLPVASAAAEAVGLPAYALATLADGVAPLPHYVARRPDDVAVVFYTSGTSGAPKGARLTHLNLVMNATVAAFDCFDFTPDDVMFGCLPLFHVFGQSCAMTAAFRAGACLVLQPRFEPREALRLMVAEKTTLMLGVPTMFLYLVQVADAGRAAGLLPTDGPIVPSLRFAVSGGAALPSQVQDQFQDAFGAPMYEGYGLSETSPVASTNQPILGTRPGTIGKPIWGVDVAVADPGVADRVVLLPDGERGELVIRGHNVFAGYPAQVGQALFGDDDLRVVLGVVHMRNHGHDAADGAVLGHRGRHKERQVAIARKVARAANAVHHARAHQVGGVDVAVDVGLDHRVHGDDAQAAHQLGVVRFLAGAG